ncbi:hypothetical protein JOF56_011377 [Kibdelosporangium banguiense]|uniref:DNRLRE domain-containing protein n=1 Tax=Kibdelosporangium banguiense TaxID=1365924 RepID=A0ABS4U2U7_9PSEU|nr:DNRLRE domain-containing protein [Kibdelosporangium banguiense]MBP2330992.1 hypothetical protein [Kibdelosporangium banguiense]
MNSAVSRLLTRAAGIMIVSGVVLTAAVVPAAATGYSTIASGSWAYVDSAAPRTSFVNPQGNAPVGAQVFASGTVHKFKSYVTFDLASLRGTRVVSATLFTNEVTVADCSTELATQAWLTASKRTPTWAAQPAEELRLPGPGQGGPCPAPRVEWDASGALRKALQEGRSSVTFAFRLPDAQQSDPRFGRTYNPQAHLTIEANRAPGKPTALKAGNVDCGQRKVVGPGGTQLSAVATDQDDSWLTYEFAYWPTRHPDRRVTLQSQGSSGYRAERSVQQSDLADATDYAWQVRAKDNLDTGPWSEVCRFSTDFIAPDKAPEVSSKDYTADAPPGSGGTGVPGEFTFKANGVDDVAGFYYGEFEAYIFVPADRRTRSATIVHTPMRSGPLSMAVRSVDAAGNQSPTTQYRFWVASNQPRVTCTPETGYLGTPRDCTFSSPSPVSAYVYSFNDGPAIEVPAGPDGTAHATVVPAAAGRFNVVTVSAKLGNGNFTESNAHYLNVDEGTPMVEVLTAAPIVGKPLQVKLTSVLPGSTSFTYTWSDDAPVTVPVGADGTAVITLISESPYTKQLAVHTTSGEIESGTAYEYIFIATNAPEINSTDYPRYGYSGEVGLPGRFTFTAAVPETVSFTYTFRGGAPVTVPAGPDGTATVELVPLTQYGNDIRATGTLADGTITQPALYTFYAHPKEPRLSCNANRPSPGERFQCTFTPVQSNVVAYVYKWGQDPEVTVPAAADGTATVNLVAPGPGDVQVPFTIWSVNNLGYRSEALSTGITTGPAGGGKAK